MFTRLSTLRLLTIFLICAVVAVWLATACTDDSGEVDPEVKEKGMTAKNLDEANEPSVVTPEVKETKANDPAKANPEAAEKDMTTENLNEPNTSSPVPPEIVENKANNPCDIDPIATGRKGMITRNSSEDVALARAIRHKYDDLFWRQPTVHGVGIGDLKDKNDEYLGIWGFIIEVTEKVDQNTLPPEDRIPDCLEGVPVEIRIAAKAELL